MSLPQVFHFDQTPIRWEVIEGKPFACAVDVARVLGYKKPADAVRQHCTEGGTVKRGTPTESGVQDMLWITEGNVVRLIARSKMPQAERFESWVFDEVIPTVLKTGSYQANAAPVVPTTVQALEALLTVAKERDALAAQIEHDRPKVEFANQVGGSLNSMSINNAAKVLGTGELRLFRWLRENRILMSGGDHHNRPYQEYLDRGYFKVVESPWKSPSGEQMKSEKTLVTAKGLTWIHRKMTEAGERLSSLPA